MSGTRKRLLVDLGFLASLLLLAAVPLIVLRDSPLLGRPGCVPGVLALAGALCVLWAFAARRVGRTPAGPASPAGESGGRLGPCRAALVAALLGALTFVGFYRPLRIQFWGGADEFHNFYPEVGFPWSDSFDEGVNRPLAALAPCLARALTPGRIEGFLWLAAGLCWLNGLLLFAVVREALPRAGVLPAAAAVLLVVNRSDVSRFFVLWTTNWYWTPLALLLSGLWLFLLSYRRGRRDLLVLSCVLLGAALLGNEGAYPLALLALLLAWSRKEHRARLPVWAFAWTGTLALLATRFLLYLLHRGPASYQASQSAGLLRHPRQLLDNLALHLGSGLSYFETSGATAGHRSAVAALALGAALVGVAGWPAVGGDAQRRPLGGDGTSGGPPAGTPKGDPHGQRGSSRRRYVRALGVSALAVLLGIAPFLHMPHAFRTRFFAAPGQAVLLAASICLVGSLLGTRAGAAFVACAVALLAASATREAVSGQERCRAESPVNFERTVHVFRQLHALSPTLSPDTLILLVRDEPRSSPLPYNYACVQLGRLLLGAPVAQANFEDPPCAPIRPLFHPDSVALQGAEVLGLRRPFAYDRLLAFRLAADGTVTLLSRLPAGLLPPRSLASGYDPLALARPGPVDELPYLRYPRWARRPRDLFDPADGIILGQGWGPLGRPDGELARRGEDGAELAVNPLGQSRRVVRLELVTGPAGRLEALDREGRVVATAPPGGRRQVCLALPTDPARVNLFRLRIPGGHEFWAVCPAAPGAAREAPAPEGPSPCTQRPGCLQGSGGDIPAGGLTLGANWYPPEHYGGQTFRWVNNDAEVLLGPAALARPANSLVLEVEPGPGVAPGPCRLQLLDREGRVLGEATLSGRGEVRLPLAGAAGITFRLHVVGGGLPTPGDPRTLNFRVFRCGWL